jgi:hypothetical protein
MAGEMDFYSVLEQLTNPTHDMGGGPGAGNAQAMAQLILGGGKASVQGADGAMQPIMGPGAAPQAAPISENLKSVLDTADQVANSLGSPHGSANPITSTLLPNPYGRGSYDPSNADAVSQVQGQGKQAQQVDTARQFISQLIGQEPTMSIGHRNSPEEMLAYQQGSANYRQRVGSASPIVNDILKNLGISGENDYIKAYNKKKGEVDAKGTKESQSYAELIKSAGNDDFEEKLAGAEAEGLTANQQLAAARLHDKRLKDKTVGDVDRRALVSVQGSVASLQKIEDAYKETEAYKTGKLSDNLKTVLALSSKGNVAVENLGIFNKLTPAEQNYVAAFNVFGMNLRRVSEDSRFSNFDSQKVIDAIGNPIVGRDQYLAQLGGAKENLITRHDDVIDGLDAIKKDTRGFKRFKEKQSSSAAPKEGATAKSKSGRDMVFKNGNWEYA